ncbi:MAG: VacB/RNase II family 3'-5' exoribonuclease, partial [Verrucomicrobiota bacterium]
MDEAQRIRALEKQILKHFSGDHTPPLTRSELARKLDISPKDRPLLRRSLLSLVEQGKVEAFKKSKYGSPSPKRREATLFGTFTFPSLRRNRHGTLSIDPACYRHLPKELPREEPLFVHERNTFTALPGDQVEFTVRQSEQPRKPHVVERRSSRQPRWEARVTKVVKRHRTCFPAIFHRRGDYVHASPDSKAIPKNFELETASLPQGIKEGHQVVVELRRWSSPSRPPLGRVLQILGFPNDPGVDILKIIHRHELPIDFPDHVLAAAKSTPSEVQESDREGREDWREKPVYTIDPATAKDFDDAIWVEPTDKGGFQLGVFIADVAHYVTPGSPMDQEAKKRGNSTYLVDRVIPMLPEALSNGVCSLNPHVERLAHAVFLTFDSQGRRTDARFAKTVIRSQRRFTYEEASELLQRPADAKTDDPFHTHLHESWELASRLRKRRFENGSLELDFPEVEVLLDSEGTPTELRLVPYDESHQLIEEFMLAANEAVAEHVKNRQAVTIYRVHEDPDAAKLFEFRELAEAYGHKVGDISSKKELQRVIREIKGTPQERALSLALLKSLKRACYAAEPLGHYGLAKSNYAHFTSPIRRYADLVTHRVLETLTTRREAGGKLPKKALLQETAEHISATERVAADAERDSKFLKQFEYLLNLTKSKKTPRFQAIVLEITPKGIFIELEDVYLRGLIPKGELPRHAYRIEPRTQRVLDLRGNILMAPG